MRATFNHYQLAITTALGNVDVVSVLSKREGDNFLDLFNVQMNVVSPLDSDSLRFEILFNYRDVEGQSRDKEDVLVELILGDHGNKVIHVRGI